MPSRLLLALLLVSPAWGQTLFERVLEHARGLESPLLMAEELADELQGFTPEGDGCGGRGHLDAWLAQRGAALTFTAAGGVVVYRIEDAFNVSGLAVTWAQALLEFSAPLVAPEDLVLRHSDLVWTLDPPDRNGGKTRVKGVVELVLGEHRLFGGRADHILQRLGRAAFSVDAPALVEKAAGPPPDPPAPPAPPDGRSPTTLMKAGEGTTGAIFTYTDGTARALDRLRIWNASGPASGTLAALGVRVDQLGVEQLRIVEVNFPPVLSKRDRWYPLELEHLERAEVERALVPRSLRVRVTRVGQNQLFLVGPPGPVQRWRKVLAQADTPR